MQQMRSEAELKTAKSMGEISLNSNVNSAVTSPSGSVGVIHISVMTAIHVKIRVIM